MRLASGLIGIREGQEQKTSVIGGYELDLGIQMRVEALTLPRWTASSRLSDNLMRS